MECFGEPDNGTEDMSSGRKLVRGGSFLDRPRSQDRVAGVWDLRYQAASMGIFRFQTLRFLSHHSFASTFIAVDLYHDSEVVNRVHLVTFPVL